MRLKLTNNTPEWRNLKPAPDECIRPPGTSRNPSSMRHSTPHVPPLRPIPGVRQPAPHAPHPGADQPRPPPPPAVPLRPPRAVGPAADHHPDHRRASSAPGSSAQAQPLPAPCFGAMSPTAHRVSDCFAASRHPVPPRAGRPFAVSAAPPPDARRCQAPPRPRRPAPHPPRPPPATTSRISPGRRASPSSGTAAPRSRRHGPA